MTTSEPQTWAAGWYPDPDKEAPYRYWNGERWTNRYRDTAPRARGSRWPLVLVLVVALGGIWSTGAFDKPLSGVGLNAHECITNGFGATFCGDQAEAYKQRVDRLTRSLGTP